MARALAAAGALVIVPEIEAWRALRVRPAETAAAIADALAAIDRTRRLPGRRVGLMGFSVAATWSLEVAAGPLAPRFAAVVGMGGYGSIEHMLVAMITGEHAWEGRPERYRPDPYGRWILGAELLPVLDDDRFGSAADRAAAGEALWRLALTAGRHGAIADAPVYDPLNAQLRAALPATAHPAWDLLAPLSVAEAPDRPAGRALASALAEAGARVAPELDPAGRLAGLTAPTLLLHGRSDRLIPWSETLRLAALLPPHVRRRVEITRLLGHTKATEANRPRAPLALAAESWRFARFIHACLATGATGGAAAAEPAPDQTDR